jgi:hypothetical protein
MGKARTHKGTAAWPGAARALPATTVGGGRSTNGPSLHKCRLAKRGSWTRTAHDWAGDLRLNSLESGLRYAVGAVATRFSIGTTSRAAWPV